MGSVMDMEVPAPSCETTSSLPPIRLRIVCTTAIIGQLRYVPGSRRQRRQNALDKPKPAPEL